MKVAGILAALAALLAILLGLVEVVLRLFMPEALFTIGFFSQVLRGLLLSGAIVIIGGALAFSKGSSGAPQQ